MAKNTPSPRRSAGIKLILVTAALIGFSLAWYVVVRAISQWTAVKVIALDIPAAPTLSPSDDGWRVATYNIANGRGGRPGEPVTGGGGRTAKSERLLAEDRVGGHRGAQ